MDQTQALEIERLVGAAQDALTDEMVSRLSATAAEGMDLLDKVNRSNVAGALPALAQLVANGDLERLTALARTYGAAQDALTDEMVGRLAETVAESLSIIDRLHRAGLDRLVGALERLGSGGALDRLDDTVNRLASGLELLRRATGSMDAAAAEMRAGPAADGGIGGLWQLMRDRENQESLRFLLAIARELRKGPAAGAGPA
jgi:uncharacterized protein YjgD (DUF1641 family)